MTRAAITFAVALCAALPCRAEVTLVQDGEPMARIVLPADAHETLALAAEELNRHLRAMSGAALPLVDEPAATVPTVLLTAWPWQGTEEFLELPAARGRVSFPHEGKPQCLDPEG